MAVFLSPTWLYFFFLLRGRGVDLLAHLSSSLGFDVGARGGSPIKKPTRVSLWVGLLPISVWAFHQTHDARLPLVILLATIGRRGRIVGCLLVAPSRRWLLTAGQVQQPCSSTHCWPRAPRHGAAPGCLPTSTRTTAGRTSTRQELASNASAQADVRAVLELPFWKSAPPGRRRDTQTPDASSSAACMY